MGHGYLDVLCITCSGVSARTVQLRASMAEAARPVWAVLIGGSAGSLRPLQEMLGRLDPELPAAVFVVQHTRPGRASHLAKVLARSSRMPVVDLSAKGSSVLSGQVYVAGPDRHLKLRSGGVELTRDPREHHTRPAIDVLFRSGARVYGARTIAIVLSGYGGDGALGATAVHARGGIVIAQSPATADAPSMPLRAISTGHVSHVLPVEEIPGRLRQIISDQGEGALDMKGDEDRIRQKIATDIRSQVRNSRTGETATIVCPDCGGVLWQDQHGQVVDFTCHIGHRWTSDTLLVQKTENLEAALLSAQRLLKEKGMLLRQTAARARDNGHLRAAERLEEQAGLDESYAELIERDLLQAEPSPLSNAAIEEDVSSIEDQRTD